MARFDLCVVGAGPSGYAAAMRAVDFGKKVLLIEKASSEVPELPMERFHQKHGGTLPAMLTSCIRTENDTTSMPRRLTSIY